MENDKLDAIKRLVVKYRPWLKPHELSGNTTPHHDLGIDGDDAYELLVDYRDTFEVDMSEFKYDQHFGPEGYSPLAPFYWLFGSGLLSITLSDLSEAAQKGHWAYDYPE